MKKYAIISSLIIIISITFYACKEESFDPVVYGSIEGIVLDAETGDPIEGASVSTTPPTEAIITGADGTFAIYDIPVTNYTINVTKSGYQKGNVGVAVKEAVIINATILLNVTTEENVPPGEPQNPDPVDKAIDQPTTITLSWNTVEIDSDGVFFDVYLFESGDPTKIQVASGISDTLVTVDSLRNKTTYFWQVIAKDSGNAVTNGNVWSFTTEQFPDLPIVYSARYNDGYELFIVPDDSTNDAGIIRLTDTDYRELYPRISPRLDKIAFVSDIDLEPQIYTINRDGSNLFQVTALPVTGSHNPGIGYAWSPDGTQLIYPHYDRLYRIDADGKGITIVANAPDGWNWKELDWSLDKSKIVALAVGARPFDTRIYLMDADGGNMTILLDNAPGTLGSPTFSVDGSQVMYTYDVSGYQSNDGRQLNTHILIVNTDGTDTTDISTDKPDGTNDLFPRFSPDGARVIFSNGFNYKTAVKSVYTMEVDGENRTLIATGGLYPDWK